MYIWRNQSFAIAVGCVKFFNALISILDVVKKDVVKN
jgi:hypothetical protein